MATSFVTAKVANYRYVLKRALRDHGGKIDVADVEYAVRRSTASLAKLQARLSLDEVRGVEGDSAHAYFQAFDHLITRQKDDFFFQKRSRRPPLDEDGGFRKGVDE